MVASPLSNVEEFILWSLGKIVAGIGVVAFIVSVSFDLLARGMPIGQWEFDWLQILGIVTSAFMVLLGVFGDSFLSGPVKAIINEWASF